ncbi:hypothetical protein Tco_1280506 [Tanacetum coccineum]
MSRLYLALSVDILSNTNFFQAFTASTNVPAIYLQQFWKTMSYNEKTGVYSCQVDEQWFDLSADLLRKALAITPVIPAQPFELPPSVLDRKDFWQAVIGRIYSRDPVSETTPKLPEVVGKGKAIVTEEQVAHSLIDLSKKKRTTDKFILVRRDQTPHDSTTGTSSQLEDETSEKVIHESSSTSDSERTESETETAAPKGDKDQGEIDSSTVTVIPLVNPLHNTSYTKMLENEIEIL